MHTKDTPAPANGGKLGIAPGKWESTPDYSLAEEVSSIVTSPDGATVCLALPNGDADSSAIRNGEFIAEAGTVCNELQLTPRQLADQRAELLEALALILADHDKCVEAGEQPGFLTVAEETKARAILTKCQREGGAA